jgi:hypothetical protein
MLKITSKYEQRKILWKPNSSFSSPSSSWLLVGWPGSSDGRISPPLSISFRHYSPCSHVAWRWTVGPLVVAVERCSLALSTWWWWSSSSLSASSEVRLLGFWYLITGHVFFLRIVFIKRLWLLVDCDKIMNVSKRNWLIPAQILYLLISCGF